MSNKFFLISSIFTSLFASSCCIIQLILNLFSIGCAGFSIFDEYERLFITLTIILLFQVYLRDKNTKKNFYFNTILCVLIISSKYIVKFYNSNAILSNLPPDSFQFRNYLVSGVNCQACAKKLCDSLLEITKKCQIEMLKEKGMANLKLIFNDHFTKTKFDSILSSLTNYQFKIVE